MSFDNIKALLLDDETISLEHSRAVLESYLPQDHIFAVHSAVEAMRLLEIETVDLVFIDIEMPDTNGFSMAEYIHTTYPQIKVVFLTGHVELGMKSFDYEPLDFLSKPVDVLRLRKTLERFEAACRRGNRSGELVALDTGTGLSLLSPADILYIAKEKRKTVIHCVEQQYAVQYTLDELEVIFGDYGIFRTHQSFLVPLHRIVSVLPADFGKTYFANLNDGSQIPVSRIQYSKLRGYLSQQGIRIL